MFHLRQGLEDCLEDWDCLVELLVKDLESYHWVVPEGHGQSLHHHWDEILRCLARKAKLACADGKDIGEGLINHPVAKIFEHCNHNLHDHNSIKHVLRARVNLQCMLDEFEGHCNVCLSLPVSHCEEALGILSNEVLERNSDLRNILKAIPAIRIFFVATD